MARVDRFQATFTAGIISPRAKGRIDFERFFDAAKDLKNFIVLPQGGARRRSGTRFVAPVKTPAETVRLIPFQFSTTQTYVLEFGNGYIRFFTQEGQLASSTATITDITKANPGVVTTSAAHGFSNGDQITLSGVVGMVEVNNRRFTIANASGSVFDIVDTSGFTAYTSGGTASKAAEVGSTGYALADLPDVKWAQSADILYLAHPTVKPKEVRRTSATTFTISDHAFIDGPYLDVNATTTTLTPSAATGSVTVTASSVVGINDDTGFQTTDIGRSIRFKHTTSDWGWMTITARASTTSVTATVNSTLVTASASTNWRLGAWSDTTGWPQAVTFHKGRLWWGGTTAQPQNVWASRAASFLQHSPSDFDGTVVDSHAINLAIDDNQVNAVHWLTSVERGLLVGTSGSEYIIDEAQSTSPLGPLNAEISRQSNRGSLSDVMSTVIGRSTVFAQRGGKVIREQAFDFDADGFTERALTNEAEHLFRAKVGRLAYAQNPDSVLWALIDDGSLAGLTFERDQRVFAWHRHVLGGTGVVAEDLAVINEGDEDQVWLCVKRTVNGGTVRYVEFIETAFDDGGLSEDMFFVDSGLTYSGAAITTITGLSHLEGESVQVLADGAALPNHTVSNGQIVLATAAAKVHAGLRADCELELLPFESGTEGTITFGRIRRIHQAHLLLLASLGGEVGPDSNSLEPILARSSADLMGAALPLITDVHSIDFPAGYARQQAVFFRNTQPLATHILAIGFDMQVHGS